MNSYESVMQDVERPPIRRTEVHPVHFAQLCDMLELLMLGHINQVQAAEKLRILAQQYGGPAND